MVGGGKAGPLLGHLGGAFEAKKAVAVLCGPLETLFNGDILGGFADRSLQPSYSGCSQQTAGYFSNFNFASFLGNNRFCSVVDPK